MAILFVPSGQAVKVNLDTPVIMLRQVTIGAPKPKLPEQPPAAPEPAAPEAVPAAPPVAAVAPEATPVPKIEELKKQAEETPPKAEQPKETPQEPEKSGPSDAELLAAALSGAKRDAKAAPKVSGGQSVLEQALKAAGSAAKSEKVVSGESGDGVGVEGSYVESIISRVRPHFTIRPRSDERVSVVLVLLELAENGRLVNVVLKKRSGDDVLDANVLRAIREADGSFEPPPKPELRKLEIPFTSTMSSAGR